MEVLEGIDRSMKYIGVKHEYERGFMFAGLTFNVLVCGFVVAIRFSSHGDPYMALKLPSSDAVSTPSRNWTSSGIFQRKHPHCATLGSQP
jgi:hypothetical protein